MAHGVSAAPSATSAEPAEHTPPDEHRSSIASAIRERLSPEGLSELRTIMFDPKLALTVAQRDLVNQLGRSAQAGDKTGLRAGIMQLAEKLDVTSPKNGTVLVLQQTADADLAAPINQEMARLEKGKRSLEMTQGGRVMNALSPVLQKKGGFSWADGLDGGWQRLNQRFAHQADGVVDVVAPAGKGGAGASAPPSAPVGRWGTAPPASGKAAVGSWSPPEGSPDGGDGGGGGVGRWGAPAKGDASSGEAAVGRWSAPEQAEAGGSPPVGRWAAPDKAAAGSTPAVGRWSESGGKPAGAAPPVGQWTAPASPDKGPAVGHWTAGAKDANADAATPVGSWSQPTDNRPSGSVGKWNAAGAGSPSPGEPEVGRWTSGGAAGDAAPPPSSVPPPAGGAPPGAPTPPASASMHHNAPVDLQNATVAGGVRLGDLIAANPKISGLRIVQVVSGSPSQPASLQEISTLGRELLKKRFGWF